MKEFKTPKMTVVYLNNENIICASMCDAFTCDDCAECTNVFTCYSFLCNTKYHQ